MARGNLTKRGESSWRMKFDIGADSVTGKRRIEYVTFKGSKREAQAELTRRLAALDAGTHVRHSIDTVADYARRWLSDIAPAKASPKTLERYAEICAHHITPRLGETALQKLEPASIDTFYQHLRTEGRRDGRGGLAPQTVLHVHRLLSQILESAVKARKLRVSPMAGVQTTPKVRKTEIQILDDGEIKTLLSHLRDHHVFVPTLIATSTGMRRGEILALRWRDVDLDRATLLVSQVLEQTKAGISIKMPKTERSRRSISLPARLVAELRAHRKAQAELYLKLGIGKPEHDLVCADWDGAMRAPRLFSKQFAAAAEACGLGHVTFHGLRHTHITQLLRSGVSVHIVSQRAGHSNPATTLNIYSHLLASDQETAAAVVDSALSAALSE